MKKECAFGYFWIAGQRIDPEDGTSDFVWKADYKGAADFTQIAMTYTNWYPGEPNSMLGIDSCVNILGRHDDKWNDQPCSTELCFICVM